MKSSTKHVPKRTCVVCKKKRPKKELFRLTTVDSEVVWDISYRLPGRGAYVCKNKQCVSGLRAFKGLSGAFRKTDVKMRENIIEKMIRELQKS